MHFFQEIYHIDSVIKLYIVKLVRNSEINEELVVICLANLICVRLFYIEKRIVDGMKDYDNLELATCLLLSLPILFEANHFLLEYTACIITDKSLLT